ncbi:hypothetical protein JW824_13695 [bacterium]|nr:hypothetical protein [bacterium]
MSPQKMIFSKVAEERLQGHATRKNLYEKIKKHFDNKEIVSFFTSFYYPVMLEDTDANILEGILRKTDLTKGLLLIISSPGGDGLAAERIINLCRSYSASNKYEVIVPGKAKSAATMVCLGANTIHMSKTSELGPVDPMLIITENGKKEHFSVFNLIKGYENLFQRAVRERNNIQPYLQQLNNYDERHINEMRMELAASKDITIKALKGGMLDNFDERQIERKVKIFLTPEKVKTHGRPIYMKDAAGCGLNIHEIDLMDQSWNLIYELYFRLNEYVSRNMIGKCIESRIDTFSSKYVEG